MAPAVKLLFDPLDALLVELRDRKIDIVRVSAAVAIENVTRTSRQPKLVSRVLATAGVGEGLWAEWRYWVGRGIAEAAAEGFRLPAALQTRRDHALAEVARRVDEAGLLVREGILTHDQGVMDSFRL